MASSFSVAVRASEARLEIARTRAELAAWLARRRQLDVLQQYATQLSVIEGVLLRALAGMEAALPADTDASLEGLDQCRRVERGTVWLRRVWSFFRVRFDQRDDPRLGPLLAAADEVVWSCYAEPFRAAGLRVPAAPLPYLDDRYSPLAVPRLDPPPDLRFDVDAAFLLEFLATLPVPVLGLPPITVDAPWRLVFVGHEVGHHVQYDLVPGGALVEAFASKVAAAVRRAGGDDAAARWGRWGREIFADAWSVLTVGPAALWALLDLEAGAPSRSMTSHLAYPSLLIRAALMDGLLSRLDTPSADALRGLSPSEMADGPPVVVDGVDLRAAYARDLALVPGVLPLLVSEPLAHGRALPDLAGWHADQFSQAGSVSQWRADYAAADGPPPTTTLEAARLAASGAIWAWADLQELAEDERGRARTRLRDRVVECVARSREPSLRAAGGGDASGADAGDRLRALVLEHAPDPWAAVGGR